MNIQPMIKSNAGPHLVQIMPNSSYPSESGGFLSSSRYVAENTTTAGSIWYGTSRPGYQFEERSIALYFLESFTAEPLPTDFNSAETNLYSEYRKTIAEIDQLVQDGRFSKARDLFGSLPEDRLDSKRAKELALALQVPSGRILAHGTGRRPNTKWLASNRNRFDGQWVALEDNELIDFDTSYKNLRSKIEGVRDSLRGIQFVRIG